MKAQGSKTLEAKLQKQYVSQMHFIRLKAKLTERSAFLKGEGFMERIRKLMSLLLILAFCFTFIPTVNVQAASKVKINNSNFAHKF